MMIDKDLEFFDDTALLGVALNSTALDLQGGNDSSIGLYSKASKSTAQIYVTVGTALAGGTSLVVSVEEADNEAFTTNKRTVATFRSIALADLTAGAELANLVLSGTYKRYLRVVVTPTGTFTAGGINAAVVESRPINNKA